MITLIQQCVFFELYLRIWWKELKSPQILHKSIFELFGRFLCDTLAVSMGVLNPWIWQKCHTRWSLSWYLDFCDDHISVITIQMGKRQGVLNPRIWQDWQISSSGQQGLIPIKKHVFTGKLLLANGLDLKTTYSIDIIIIFYFAKPKPPTAAA